MRVQPQTLVEANQVLLSGLYPLLPCRFCGMSEWDTLQEKDLDDWIQLSRMSSMPGPLWYVECFRCGVQTRCFETVREAIAAWSRWPAGRDTRTGDGMRVRELLDDYNAAREAEWERMRKALDTIELTEQEKIRLSVIAVSPSNETEWLLELIEWISGYKIEAADKLKKTQ